MVCVFRKPENQRLHCTLLHRCEKIKPSGNMLWMKDKNFGMGKDHPVAWYGVTGRGRTFYTSIEHDAEAWKQDAFVQMLENVISTSENQGKKD